MSDEPLSVRRVIAAETPLSELTTMGVGGQAQHLVVATTSADIVTAVRLAERANEPWCLLAGGSNSVFADAGFTGTVIVVRTSGIEELASGRLRVQAGHGWSDLVTETVARGLAGIEALAGIPGSVGAAPIQNIGAYGQELSDVLESVEFFDVELDEVVELSAIDLELGYRTSSLKRGRRGAVLSVTVKLGAPSDASSTEIRYAQLANALGVDVGARADLQLVHDTVLALRSKKGMVYRADDLDSHGSGSFFTNPIVTHRFAESLPEDAPRWPAGEVDGQPLVKLSAAWLIEYAGVRKGFSLPGSHAAISTKHSLAVTNRGGATAEQIAELARFVLQRVQSDTGVNLQPEPVLYGIEL